MDSSLGGASMSLSRRFLSLPQELEGVSLPPQVDGKRCGTVLLCVGHILESAVSSRPLPKVSLVRVRWWGEEQPRSLFRPTLLSGEGPAHVADEEESPSRAIAMKYPVVVPPEQLEEYFRDMRNLTLDVIDRKTRRKFGQCNLKLDVESENSVLTAKEKLVALRREDVLCEIKSSEKEDEEVLGYLAVTFDVQWNLTVEEMKDADGKIHVEALSSASSNSLPSKREWAAFEIDREVSSSLDMESELLPVRKEVATESKRMKVDDVVDVRGSSDDTQTIQRLLEKGKALKQSMERAVKDKREEDTSENIPDDRAMKEIRDALLLPDKEFTTSIFSEDRKSHLVSLDSTPQLHSQVSTILDKYAANVRDQNKTALRVNADANFSILSEVNTLSLAFESLELEHSFVENQLRQLRDSSSVSSRFSPIQIHVSHGDVASLLYQNLGGAQLPEVHAFSVSTSLRKRQWHLECTSTSTSTMPLTPPSCTVEISSTGVLPKPSKVDATKWLKFHVRCENQSDARRNMSRTEQHLYPRSSKCYILEGTVNASTLLSVAAGAEKTWATTIELFVVEGFNQRDGNKSSSKTREGLPKHKVVRNNKALAVGKLHVRFSFYDVSVSSQNSESDSAGNEQESEYLLSSITTGSDIHQDYQSIGSVHVLPQTSERAVQSKLYYDLESTNSRIPGSGWLQLGVILEDVTNVKFSGLGRRDPQPTIKELTSRNISTEEGKGGGDGMLLNGASISLHYTVPTKFTTISPASIKFERTVRRKLNTAHWQDSASALHADFGGHIHVFQTMLAEDASNYFSSGQLIIEVWLHASKDTDRMLLGLSKLPLRKFTQFLRRKGSDLHDFSEQSLPYIGVDGQFPICNPFNGNHAGYLRVRVCMGTAEQLLTFATTIRSFVKFQGVARGVLYRKHFGRLHALNTINCDSQSAARDFDSCTATPVIHETSRSTTPTANTTAGISVDLDDVSEGVPVDFKSEATGCGRKLLLHKIRFDICECWRAVQQREKQAPEFENALRGWRTSPLLGCELQGQMVLIGGDKSPNDLKGIPFALWWDAADSKLNSCFVHAFQTRRAGLDRARGDRPVLGLQSQVLFALSAENGFFGTQSRQTISGEARVNLHTAFEGGRYLESAGQHYGVEDKWIVLDVPIKWGCENSEGQMLPTVLPLKISYQVSVASLAPTRRHIGPKMMAYDNDFSDDSSVVKPCRDSFASTSSDKLLQPASIAISFRVLAVANIEHLLTGNGHQEWSNDLYTTSIASHLHEVLAGGSDYHSVLFEITLCLGSERHKREGNMLEHEFEVRVFQDRGIWYKRWRSLKFPVQMRESRRSANFDTLSSQLAAMHAHLVLTPEVVTKLQEACANVVVLLWCNACNAPHEIGNSEVPMGAVLYRAEGIRGMFPICIGTEPTAARVGVHCFIDHGFLNSVSADSSATTEGKSRLGDNQLIIDRGLLQPPLPLMSPTSPEEITQTDINSLNSGFKKSCEVWIEEGRNIVVDGGETERCAEVPRLYATLQVKFRGIKQNDPEPNWNSVKKTEVKVGVCPQWNYRDVLDAADVDWQNLVVEVLVWQDNCDFSHRSCTVTKSARRRDFRPRSGDIFVGNVQVDLSLFARGWRDIDGWFHLLDEQQQNRGQIKVHVRNIMVEEILEDKNFANSVGEPSWRTVNLSTHNFREINPESISKDALEPPQLSLDSAVLAVHQASKEIHEQLKSLQISEEPLASKNQDASSDDLVARDDPRQTTGAEKDSFTHLNAGSEPQEAVGDQLNEVLEANPTVLDAELIDDEPNSGGDGSEEYSCTSVSVHASNMGESDEDEIGSDEGELENDSLEITTDFFNRITQASFGIEEMELSPLTEGDASVDGNMHDDDLEADDASYRPCGKKSEEEDVVQCEDSELSCEESSSDSTSAEFENVESKHTATNSETVGEQMEQRLVTEDCDYRASCGNNNAAGEDIELTPEFEDVHSDSDDEGTTPTNSAPERSSVSHQVDARSRGGNHDGASISKESKEFDLDTCSVMSISDSLKESEDEASLSANIVVGSTASVNIGVDVEMLERKETSRSNISASVASELGADNDAKEGQLECDSSDNQNVQYADKAIQVDLFALGLQADTAKPRFTETKQSFTSGFDDGSKIGHSYAEQNALRCEKISTADVGCDAMERSNIRCLNEDNCQFEGEGSEASSTVDLQGEIKVNEKISEVTATGGKVGTTGSPCEQTAVGSVSSSTRHTNADQAYDQGIIQQPNQTFAAPSTELQSEKLELVYDMLREMRDSYFSKPLSEPVRDAEFRGTLKEENKKTASNGASLARCRCPSPDHSKGPTSFVAEDTRPLLARLWTSGESKTRALFPSIGDKSRRVCEDDTQKSARKLHLVERQMQARCAQLDNTKPATILRGSLYNTGGTRLLRDTQASRMSSSDVWITKQRNDGYSHRPVVQKEEHSSVQSLFAHDSETERIARIMQGSMKYWMKEDSSSSDDDNLNDDEDTTDDDCYF